MQSPEERFDKALERYSRYYEENALKICPIREAEAKAFVDAIREQCGVKKIATDVPEPGRVFSPEPGAGPTFFEAITAWIHRKIVPLSAVAAVFVGLAVVVPRITSSSTVTLHWTSPTVIERNFAVSLPKNLKVDFRQKTIRLFETKDMLSGNLVATNSSAAEAVFSIDLRGKDEAGIDGRLVGRVRFVRKSPDTPIKNQADIERAIVEGEFTVGNQGSQPVSFTYSP